MSPRWIWSAPHKDHYYYDANNIIHWANSTASQPAQYPMSPHPQGMAQQPSYQQHYPTYPQTGHPASDYPIATSHIPTQSSPSYTNTPSSPQSHFSYQGYPQNNAGQSSQSSTAGTPRRHDSVVQGRPNNVHPGQPMIHGTPGQYESLDPSYRMRTGREAHDFFKIGRVFAMLWSETASATVSRNGTDNSCISYGRFGQGIYSQIRRFVVVAVNRRQHFVKACAIFTYGGRATTKPGIIPEEHAAAYFTGHHPRYAPGENRITKDPIEIYPADHSDTMQWQSRIRFGRAHPIDWNVKIKDIGMVIREHRTKLLVYWHEEDSMGDEEVFDV